MPDGMYYVQALIPRGSDFSLKKAKERLTKRGRACKPAKSETGGNGLRFSFGRWTVVAWLDDGKHVLRESKDLAKEAPAEIKGVSGCDKRLDFWSDEDRECEHTDDWGILIDDLLCAFPEVIVFDPVDGHWWPRPPIEEAKLGQNAKDLKRDLRKLKELGSLLSALHPPKVNKEIQQLAAECPAYIKAIESIGGRLNRLEQALATLEADDSLLALLALATSSSGRWGDMDGLLDLAGAKLVRDTGKKFVEVLIRSLPREEKAKLKYQPWKKGKSASKSKS